MTTIEKTEKKEERVIARIVNTINQLDESLRSLDKIEESSKTQAIKKWYEEKKAMHEIKNILHEVGRYEQYDEKELEQWNTELTKIIETK